MKSNSSNSSESRPRKSPKLPSEALIGKIEDATASGNSLVEAYYDSVRKEYLSKNAGGRWLAHCESGFKRLLKSRGLAASLTKEEKNAGETLSEVEWEMLRIQDHFDVKYAAPLAGRSTGFYEENGERFLVTESPRLISPSPGDWPLIRAVLTGLVAGPEEPHAEQQLQHLYGWLSSSVVSLYSGRRRPGQALVLAGPAGCGKSVGQNNIITPVLGGRAAKCAPYLQGKTSFNGELFGAEHLMLEDEHSETNIRSRLALASNIKQICVNALQPCHFKNRTIVNLPPFWRLTISLNDEAERMLVIPPLASDILDKIIILRCRAFHWPQPIRTLEQWSQFTAALHGEMPAFIDFLLSHRIPPAYHSDRYGVAEWHHPDLAGALDEMAPEAHLAELVVRCLDLRHGWRGTADELRTVLMSSSLTDRDARDLLHWPNACGTYLARLEAKPRPLLTVRQHRSPDRREWIITMAQT